MSTLLGIGLVVACGDSKFDPGLVESTAVTDPSSLRPRPNPNADKRFIGWDKIINILQTDQCIFLYRRSGGVYTLHTRKMVYSENVAATDKYGIQVAVFQRETADPGEYKIEIHVTCAFPWDGIAHKELLAQLYAIFPASETRSASIRIRNPVAHFATYNPALMPQSYRMPDINVTVESEPEELCEVGFDRDAFSGECERSFVGEGLETVMFPIGEGFIPPGWGTRGGQGEGGGDDDDDETTCTDDQMAIAAEYNDPDFWPCTKFADQITRGDGTEDHVTGYLTSAVINSRNALRNAVPGAWFESDWRCPNGNAALPNSSPTSEHLWGNALDLDAPGFNQDTWRTFREAAFEWGVTEEGISDYRDPKTGCVTPGRTWCYSGSIHVDWR